MFTACFRGHMGGLLRMNARVKWSRDVYDVQNSKNNISVWNKNVWVRSWGSVIKTSKENSNIFKKNSKENTSKRRCHKKLKQRDVAKNLRRNGLVFRRVQGRKIAVKMVRVYVIVLWKILSGKHDNFWRFKPQKLF